MAGSGPGVYRSVLRVPRAAAFTTAAAVVRLGQAMLGLGAVLLLVQTGHSYGVAGLVAGALSVARGVVAPQVSRLVDRHGQRTVVLPQLVVHVVAVVALVLLVTGPGRDSPSWASVVAVARQQGAPGVAGVMLGLWAAGSLVSGTVYGARAWRAAGHRFRLSAAGMAGGTLLVTASAATGSLPLTTAALVVAGVANAPTLITGNVLVPTMATPQTLTEAYTWLGVSVFLGIAVGSAVGGVLVDQRGPVAALVASVLAGAVAAAGAALTTRSARGNGAVGGRG